MQDPNKTRRHTMPTGGAVQALRARAEELAQKQSPLTSINPEILSPDDMRQMLHELRVHQIELEMQNDELQRTHAELEVASARYFDLYDLAPVGHCTLGEQGLIQDANFAAATLLGLRKYELIGKPLSRFIFSTDQDIYYRFRQQCSGIGAQSCELQIVKSNGMRCWVQLSASTTQANDGAYVTRIVLNDINERKRFELIVQEQEEQYRTLFELVPLGIYSIDSRGCIQKYNRMAEKLWGQKPNLHHTGVRFDGSLRLFHTDGSFMPHEQCPMAAVVSNKVTNMRDAEVVIERPDGSRITVASNIEPLKTRDGVITGAVNCFYDVTERRKFELALKNAMNEAAEANRAKSDFLSGMSHELRTPLNAILGFAQLMESGTPPLSASQKSSTEQILRAGWYLLELVNEILDLAYIESGHLALSTESIPLAKVFMECESMVVTQASKFGITLSFPSPDIPYYINADPVRIKQVFVNFLSNAVKYNRVGGAVNVTCAEISPRRIRICFEDTGEGLSQEKIPHLFEPFNRLGREALAEEGTGIGLMMAKRLVELMGGSIGVESTVGKGSRFWIEMDLAQRRQVLQATDAPDAPEPHQQSAPLRTVLYIEDNLANLMLVEKLIERLPNVRLLSAINGNSGTEMACAALPDVILLDINLPDISGKEVLKILRTNVATANIPILALSAHATTGDINKGMEMGFFRYLTKPIEVKAFMLAMGEALNASRYTRVASR